MAGLSDYRLKPNERWLVRSGNTLEKVPLKKQGPFSKFSEWASGASRLKNILKVVKHRTSKMGTDSRKDIEALVALRKSVDLSYGRQGGFSRWFDHTLRRDRVRRQKEEVLDAIYDKIRTHFFGPDHECIVEKTGNWKASDRLALDTVYYVLTSRNASDDDLHELDHIVSVLQPSVNQRRVWYTEMTNLGYPSAYYCLAKLYEHGDSEDIASNPGYALKYYEEAANQSNTPAQLKLEKAYRYGDETLGVQVDKALAHQWAVKASSKDDAAALRVSLDLIDGFGVEKNKELAQTKLLGLVDSAKPDIQAKAAYYASELATDDETAQRIIVDALKGLGIRIDEDINLCGAKFELANYILKRGDSALASAIYSRAIKAALDGLKSNDVDAAVCLIKIDRDQPHLLTTVPERTKSIYCELGLSSLLAAPDKPKATLEWMSARLKGAPLGADLAGGVTELTLSGVGEAFSSLSDDQQVSIENLVIMATQLHPDGIIDADMSLLAGALFGTPNPSDTLVSIARLLAEGAMERPEGSS